MALVPLQVLIDFRGSRVDRDMDLLMALLPKSVASEQRHTVWYEWIKGKIKCFVWSGETRLALICYKQISVPELTHGSMFKWCMEQWAYLYYSG